MNAPDNSTRIFYGYTAPTRYSHSSRPALTDRPKRFSSLKRLSPSTRLVSTLLGLMGEPCAHCSHVCECIHTLAVLVAVVPLSALESDAKLHIKIHLSSTFTIFNITLTFVYN